MKKTILLYLCIIAGLFTKAQTTDDYKLDLMSFNVRVAFVDDGVNSWQYRKHILLDVIRDNIPDVLCLQEPISVVINTITEEFPVYSIFGHSRNGLQSAASESCHVLFRNDKFIIDKESSGTFWYSDTPEVPGTISWGAAYIRICTYVRLIDKITGKGFYVYNSHWDNKSENSRQMSSRYLTERINTRQYQKDPFVIFGDLNAGENTIEVSYLKDGVDNPVQMIDTYRQISPDDNGYTKHEFNGIGDKRIDYIMVEKTGDFNVLDATIIHYNEDGSYPSDHFPITARVEFTKKEPKLVIVSNEPIYAGEENGKLINISLTNDVFAETLNPYNWNLRNLPAGVTKGVVTKVNDTKATIALEGNATQIYTTNIHNLSVDVTANEFYATSTDLSQNIGVVLHKLAIQIPGKIEAEKFNDKFGIQIKAIEDDGNEESIFSVQESWSEYEINVAKSGNYTIAYRITTSGRSLKLVVKSQENEADTVEIQKATNWDLAYSLMYLEAGRQKINIKSTASCKINWINIIEGDQMPTITINSAEVAAASSLVLDFSRVIDNASLIPSDFSISINGTDNPVALAETKVEQDTRVIISLANDIQGGEVVKINYTPGTAKGTDGALLEAFTHFNVTNELVK